MVWVPLYMHGESWKGQESRDSSIQPQQRPSGYLRDSSNSKRRRKSSKHFVMASIWSAGRRAPAAYLSSVALFSSSATFSSSFWTGNGTSVGLGWFSTLALSFKSSYQKSANVSKRMISLLPYLNLLLQVGTFFVNLLLQIGSFFLKLFVLIGKFDFQHVLSIIYNRWTRYQQRSQDT